MVLKCFKIGAVSFRILFDLAFRDYSFGKSAKDYGSSVI